MAWTYSNDKREQELWLIKFNPKHPDITYPIYRIFVDTFYKYEKTWWDTFCDNIKRILRIQSEGFIYWMSNIQFYLYKKACLFIGGRNVPNCLSYGSDECSMFFGS